VEGKTAMQLTNLEVHPVHLKGTDALALSVEKEWFCGESRLQGGDDYEGSPFVKAVLVMVRRFVQAVDQADFRDREHFQQAMWTLGSLGVAEQELAGLLSTTPNSINRWMNGRSAPAPVVRSIVVRAGLDILRRDGMKVAGQRYNAVNGRPMAGLE
jgi:hypothetical protein